MAKSKAKTEDVEVKAEAVEEKAEEKKAKPKAEKPEEKRVMVMVPYVEGEDKEVTVWINDKITKFKKGVTVEVPESVAKVLARSNKNMMYAIENQKKFKKQVMDL